MIDLAHRSRVPVSPRRRITSAAALCCVAIILSLIWFIRPEAEPRYNGRSLSEWFLLWEDSAEDGAHESPVRAEEAAQAIRQIGTNSLPLLLNQLRRETSPAHQTLVALSTFLPRSIYQNRFLASLLNRGHLFATTSTFVILGPQASPAVSELNAFMYSTQNLALASSATYCLVAVGY